MDTNDTKKLQSSIAVRRIEFPFPEKIDPLIIKDNPEESFFFIGLSLLLPYLEPYLIRSMAEARKHIKDEKLLRDVEAFVGQESQHYRQHAEFNKCILLDRREKLSELEKVLAEDYQRFTKSRSLRFNLAYAEGFEALTDAFTLFSLESNLLDKIEPEVRDLFRWHMVEELEHRTVAYDVYHHVSGSYFYRVAVGLYAQWHFLRFVFRVERILKNSDPEAFRERHGGFFKSLIRVGQLHGRLLTSLLPKVLRSHAPWYNPRKLVVPDVVGFAGQEYTELARGIAVEKRAAS